MCSAHRYRMFLSRACASDQVGDRFAPSTCSPHHVRRAALATEGRRVSGFAVETGSAAEGHAKGTVAAEGRAEGTMEVFKLRASTREFISLSTNWICQYFRCCRFRRAVSYCRCWRAVPEPCRLPAEEPLRGEQNNGGTSSRSPRS